MFPVDIIYNIFLRYKKVFCERQKDSSTKYKYFLLNWHSLIIINTKSNKNVSIIHGCHTRTIIFYGQNSNLAWNLVPYIFFTKWNLQFLFYFLYNCLPLIRLNSNIVFICFFLSNSILILTKYFIWIIKEDALMRIVPTETVQWFIPSNKNVYVNVQCCDIQLE